MARGTVKMRNRGWSHGAALRGVIVGLITLLAMPGTGVAIVAMQTTDEPPHKPTPSDLELIERLSAPTPTPRTGAAFDPFTAPGTPFGRGTTQASGAAGVMPYVVEEVPIPAGASVQALQGRANPSMVVRLTVIGGPIQIRAMSPVIWIDDTPLEWVSVSPDLTRLTALVPDRSVLRPGAVVAVSYGQTPPTDARRSDPPALGPGTP
jgi:hypothetical protein